MFDGLIQFVNLIVFFVGFVMITILLNMLKFISAFIFVVVYICAFYRLHAEIILTLGICVSNFPLILLRMKVTVTR